jgi:hypothetical protein
MALMAPPELLGIHTNMPATVPADISKALASGTVPPNLSADEMKAIQQLSFFYSKGLAYAQEMVFVHKLFMVLRIHPSDLLPGCWIMMREALN